MQQPPPRGKRSFWQWYRAQTRFARIGLGCASIFVALLLCTVALTVYGSTLPPTRAPAPTQAPTNAVVLTTPRPTATQAPRPTATPTTTPTRIPTPTPSKVTVPHLGGAITDFIAKYGQPVDHSDPYTYGWFRGNNGDSLRVSTLIDPHHVDEIDVQAVNGDMSNTASASALCTAFNPNDARQLRRVPVTDPSGLDSGFDVVYISSSLAREDTSDQYQDSQQNNVTPGTFDIKYNYMRGTQSIGSCEVLIGDQQEVP
jgi:hypothetical protein